MASHSRRYASTNILRFCELIALAKRDDTILESHELRSRLADPRKWSIRARIVVIEAPSMFGTEDKGVYIDMLPDEIDVRKSNKDYHLAFKPGDFLLNIYLLIFGCHGLN